MLQLVSFRKQTVDPVIGVGQTSQADIVGSSLHEHGGELTRNHTVQQWQVLSNQLLLQTDRVRGNNNPAGCWRSVLATGHGQDGWNQVGQTLAGSRSRLNDQMSFVSQGVRNRIGHLQLLRSQLVTRHALGQASVRSKNLAWLQIGHSTPTAAADNPRRLTVSNGVS